MDTGAQEIKTVLHSTVYIHPPEIISTQLRVFSNIFYFFIVLKTPSAKCNILSDVLLFTFR